MANYIKRFCPVCQQPSTIEDRLPYPTKEGGNASLSFECIVSCGNCGLSWAEPVVSQAKLDEFYSAGDYWDKLIPESSVQQVHESCQAKNRVATCEVFLNKKNANKILDIGAGHGFISRWCGDLLGSQIVQYDFIEPDQVKRDEILKSSCSHSINAIEDLASCNDKYDLIFLNHVLEHVEHPVSFIRQVKGLLNRGGLLYIEVPNQDYLFKSDVFPHTLFFNLNSLSQLATQLDFEILSIRSFGSDRRGLIEGIYSQLYKLGVYFANERVQAYFDAKLWKYDQSSEDGIWLQVILKEKLNY